MNEEIIKIQGVSKAFQPRADTPPVYALKEIDLSIKKGEIFGIIGMSGAGKSTLIRCLTALEKPSEGQIEVAGEELTSLNSRELRQARKRIGMIFQHFNLFSSRTALENVIFPLEISGSKHWERARELLALVGLKGKENHYPPQLSGGEKQRVAIARALANKPEVLLCDEATSALDPRTTLAILDLLSELNQALGLTIVMITHEMEVIKRIATHVAVLEHGEIVEQGSVADLFATPKHPTTQRFLQNLAHEVPERFLPIKEGNELLRLSFKGEGAGRPVISRLLKQFDVEINILTGGIDVLKTETVGNLIVELSGSVEERAKARAYLVKEGVGCDELV